MLYKINNVIRNLKLLDYLMFLLMALILFIIVYILVIKNSKCFNSKKQMEEQNHDDEST